MLKAMLIDDEPLALRQLESLLLKEAEIEVVAKLTDSIEAVKLAIELQPDVIFLDIHMSEVDGLETAEQLLAYNSQMNIVFVTAFDQYAIQAFELHAIDYLLKPVQINRLRKTLSRLTANLTPGSSTAASSQAMIVRCLRQLQIEKDKVIPLAWRTAKAQELFAYLLHQFPHSVIKEQLMDLLWPDLDGRKALSILYATVYHVRKLLADWNIPITIESKLGSYLLQVNKDEIEIDFDRWHAKLISLEALSEATLPAHIRCFNLYTGDYLSEHDYLWAEAQRQHLHRLWINHAYKLCEYLQLVGQLEEALRVSVRILAMNPLDENAHWQVMKLYRQMNNRQALDRQYELLQRMVEEELATTVPIEIQDWYMQVKSKIDMSI